MFTGIVQAVGEVVKLEGDGGASRLWVRSPYLEGCAAGASVAVDGVCLTVARRDGPLCRFDLTPETLARTTLGARAGGDRVNLERPLRVGEEVGGHFVQGHVDGVGTVEEVWGGPGGGWMRISVPASLTRYLAPKGSVAVDGVSLTVAAVCGQLFEVALVPHTLQMTTLGERRPGDRVNIEVDVLAKYLERMSAGPAPQGG